MISRLLPFLLATVFSPYNSVFSTSCIVRAEVVMVVIVLMVWMVTEVPPPPPPRDSLPVLAGGAGRSCRVPTPC